MRLAPLVLLLAACGTKNSSNPPPIVNVNVNPIQATTLSHWLDTVQLKLDMVRVPGTTTTEARVSCFIEGATAQPGLGSSWTEAQQTYIKTIRGQPLTIVDAKDSTTRIFQVPGDLTDGDR